MQGLDALDCDSPKTVQLDLIEERLVVNGRPLDLPRKPYEILCYLVRNPQRVIKKAELLSRVWPDTFVSEAVIKGYVRKLRHVLGDSPKQARFIETVHGRGYRYLGGIAIVQSNRDASDRGQRHAVDSIAIYPFGNLDQDPVLRRMSQGLTVELVRRLSVTRHYKVIKAEPQNPAAGDKDAPEPWTALRARFHLTGTLERLEGRLRATLYVQDATTGETRWSRSFDRAPTDSASDLNHLARTVVGNLCGIYRRLLGPALPLPADRLGAEWNARDHVRRGLFFNDQGTKRGNEKAVSHFFKAVSLDPEDCRAHQAFAFALLTSVRHGWAEWPEGTLRRAQHFARRAIELDLSDYASHWALGASHLLLRNHDDAREALESALRLCPDVPDLIADYGELLLYMGDPESAAAKILEAASLNSDPPVYYAAIMARARADLGDLEEALDVYRALGPVGKRFLLEQAALLVRCNRVEEARKLIDGQPDAANCTSLKWFKESRQWGRPYRDPAKARADLERDLDCLRRVGLAA